MTEFVEKTISNIIESDFPQYKREEGPVFVEFVKSYYKWLESSNNTIYHSRRLMEYGDVDETIDDFLVYFKEKYLKNIQFETQTNTRQLIKHTLDLYRSKGTERSVALLFALVFGENVEVYYPGEDLMRLSDGSWVKPTYLEVTPKSTNVNFVGKQITGTSSGATAFVERLIRRKIAAKYIEVFYISAVRGNFSTNEKVTYSGADINECPYMIGSTTTLEVIDGGVGFSKGDIVTLESNNGVQGKGRVIDVELVTGIVQFELLDGLWGYTANAEVLVSEKVLTLSNTVIYHANSVESDQPYQPFKRFEQIIQPLAGIEYEYANNVFTNGDIIETYYSNGSVSGAGRVLVANIDSNTQNGNLVVSITSGNLQSNTIYRKQGNSVTANLVASGYTDLTATANVMAWSSNVTIRIANTTGSFLEDEYVYQTGLGGETIAEGALRVINANGVFKANSNIQGLISGASAKVVNFDINIGVIDISNNDFYSNGINFVYTQNNNANAILTRISSGTGANFSISNNLLRTEEVRVDLEFIRDFLTVELDAATYGMSNAAANSGTIILDAIETANVTMGQISLLTAENPGTNYDTAPFVAIFEPYVAPYWKHDYIIKIANISSSFLEGEIITQDTTGAQALVTSANSSTVNVRRIQFNNTFSNSNFIVGEASGAQADVIEIIENPLTIEIGLNANVTSNVVSGNGVVAEMAVYDSGFGYLEDETVSFVSSDGLRAGRVKISLEQQGQSEGYYRSKGGFLSANKYIHDGMYYQEYSYEVRSSITLDKYAEMLKQVIHVAGTKLFGGYVKKSLANTNISLANSSITIS
jgi:hypothetical protein